MSLGLLILIAILLLSPAIGIMIVWSIPICLVIIAGYVLKAKI